MSKKPLLYAIFIITTLLLLVFVSCSMYFYQVQSVLKSEIQSSLKEISVHTSIIIENKIKGCINDLETLAYAISTYDEINEKEAIEFMNFERERCGFADIAVDMPDGTSYSSDGIVSNVSSQDYFTQSISGTSCISNIISSSDDNIKSMVYSVPIYKLGKIIGVLHATNSIDTVQKLFNVESFGGKGYSLIVRSNGDVINSTHSEFNLDSSTNIFKHLKDYKTIDRLKYDFKNNKSGLTGLLTDGSHLIVNYAPLNINDWYLMSIVPYDVLDTTTSSLIYSTLTICIMIAAIFLLFIVYILKSRKKLSDIAFVDPITNTQNWNKFKITATNILQKNKDKDYAIISLDINKFKLINDIYGSQVGDNALRYLSSLLEEFIGDSESFARVSADKFDVLVVYKSDEDIVNRIKKLNTSNHFSWGGKNYYYLDLSYGIYRLTDKTLSIDIMSDRSNIARKNIKGKHNVLYSFYDEGTLSRMIAEKEIENTMEKALENGEFVMFLQPKYELENNTIAGAEALVRWIKPGHGIIPPDSFIPLFERNGFIIKIDYYMFEQVCINIKKWLDLGATPVTISVNLSRVHLRSLEFITIYKELVKKYDIPPHFIEIELTESLVFDNMEVLTSVINELKDIGFSCSLDDFGTGYSSLNVLKEIPVDVLKLDKEFFCTNEYNEMRSNTVVSGVIALAKSLDIKTISEGVETSQQVSFLKNSGCDMIQGYIFAKPMPINEFEKLWYSDKH